jgi:hypothetical protein
MVKSKIFAWLIWPRHSAKEQRLRFVSRKQMYIAIDDGRIFMTFTNQTAL